MNCIMGYEFMIVQLLPPRQLSNRYITERFLPDKAIDLIDEACAMIRTEIDSMPQELRCSDKKNDAT